MNAITNQPITLLGVRDHGILMKPELAKASERGDKTMTRRLVTQRTSLQNGTNCPPRIWKTYDFSRAWVDPGPSPAGNEGPYLKAPRPVFDSDGKAVDEVIDRIYPKWQVGDRIYVKETWTAAYRSGCFGTIFRADGAFVQGKRRHEKGPFYNADDRPPGMLWRPSIFLPRWAARLWFEVTAVRPERVQNISESDANAEGVEAYDGALDEVALCRRAKEMGIPPTESRVWFAELWDTINFKRSPWSNNDWVWVISYRRLETP
jgi:hypothetical protein